MNNMYKLSYRVLVVSVFFSFGFAGSSAQARSLDEIRASQEIRICLAGSSQEFYKNNALAFVKFLGKGIKAKFVSFKNWNDQFLNQSGHFDKDGEYTPEPLASGRCDLYPNDLTKLDWRKRKLAYVDLFTSRNVVIVNEARLEKFHRVEDLAGKTAAVMKGTSYHDWLEEQNVSVLKLNPMRLVFVPQKEAIKGVSDGIYDLSVSGADGAFWSINNFASKASAAFIVGEERAVYGWCFRKQDTQLQQQVKAFFDDQLNRSNSEINLNWKKYIGISLEDFGLFVSSAK